MCQGPARMGLLEHPEDLGVTPSGKTPASIWSWPSVKALLDLPNCLWGALSQLAWGRSWDKPTRLMGNFEGLKSIVHVGPPQHDGTGKYLGPLPADRPKGKVSLIGRDAKRAFRTAAAAAWPPQLCSALAEATVAAHISLAAKTSRGGGPASEPAGSPSPAPAVVAPPPCSRS